MSDSTLTAEYLPSAQARPIVEPIYEQHPMASVFDTPLWVQVLVEGLGYRVGWIVWRREGKVVGCLPVGWSLKVWKQRAMSLPFTTWVHPNWIDGAMPEEAWSIAFAALQRAGAKTWIVKGHVPGGSPIAGRYVESIIDIDRPLDEVRANYKKRVRWSVSKARRSGVEIREWRHDDAGLVALMIEHNRKSKGMPAFPRKYWDAIERLMIPRGLAQCWLAWHGERLIAVNLDVPGPTWHMMIGASLDDEESRRLRANNLLQDVVIEAAHEHGSTHVSFGLSPVELESLRSFKRGYGAEEIETTYTQFPPVAPAPANTQERTVVRLLKAAIQRMPEALYYPLSRPFIVLWEW